MAVIGIHKNHLIYPEVMQAIRNFCSSVEFVGWQDENIAVYRVNGEGLSTEDLMVSFELQFFYGVYPLVIQVQEFNTLWQPLST